MRHFIISGAIGITLTLSSMAMEKTGDPLEIGKDILQKNNQTDEQITIIPEGPSNSLLADADFDTSDTSETPQSSIMSQCLAQIVGKTRLMNQFSFETTDYEKCKIMAKVIPPVSGLILTIMGGGMMNGRNPQPYNDCIGLIISGAVLLTPLTCSILSEVVFQGAKCLGKGNFIRQADDAQDAPIFMSDWTGHLTQGSLGAKNCLSWFCTPCCGPTT